MSLLPLYNPHDLPFQLFVWVSLPTLKEMVNDSFVVIQIFYRDFNACALPLLFKVMLNF